MMLVVLVRVRFEVSVCFVCDGLCEVAWRGVFVAVVNLLCVLVCEFY